MWTRGTMVVLLMSGLGHSRFGEGLGSVDARGWVVATVG